MTETTTVQIKTGQTVIVTPAQAKKMKPHRWRMPKDKKTIATTINNKTVILTRFLYDVSDPNIYVRRHDNEIFDLSPNNAYLWDQKKRCAVPFDNELQPVSIIPAPEPAPQRRVLTSPPSPTITRTMFIDIDGAGMIVSANAIARIDLTDPDVVEVELLSQQFAETGRDTKPTSYVYDGEAARHVRLWAMALTDETGAKLIDLVIDLQNQVANLQQQNDGIKNGSQAKLETLIKKLRAIGFDPDKLV